MPAPVGVDTLCSLALSAAKGVGAPEGGEGLNVTFPLILFPPASTTLMLSRSAFSRWQEKQKIVQEVSVCYGLFRLNCIDRRGTTTDLLGERFGDPIFVIVAALVVVHFVYARHLRVHAIKGAAAACGRFIS